MKTKFFLSIASSMAILLSMSPTCSAQGMDVGNLTTCAITVKAEYANCNGATSKMYFDGFPNTITDGSVIFEE